MKLRILHPSVPLDGCPMAPNFLLMPMGPTNFMRLSLKERRTRGLVQGSVQEIRGVCTGVAGALHGLKEVGRSPFRCCLSRAAKPRNEGTLSRPAPACREGCRGRICSSADLSRKCFSTRPETNALGSSLAPGAPLRPSLTHHNFLMQQLLRLLEHLQPLRRQILARTVDIKRQHPHP